MKKKIAYTMLTMALVTGAFLVGKMPTTSKANEEMKVLYPRATVITFVDRITDTVICEDSAGEVWEFYGCDDWNEGDICTLMMEDTGVAEYICDDTIIETVYGGTVDDLEGRCK